jgi:hypothetical protein
MGGTDNVLSLIIQKFIRLPFQGHAFMGALVDPGGYLRVSPYHEDL